MRPRFCPACYRYRLPLTAAAIPIVLLHDRGECRTGLLLQAAAELVQRHDSQVAGITRSDGHHAGTFAIALDQHVGDAMHLGAADLLAHPVRCRIDLDTPAVVP